MKKKMMKGNYKNNNKTRTAAKVFNVDTIQHGHNPKELSNIVGKFLNHLTTLLLFHIGVQRARRYVHNYSMSKMTLKLTWDYNINLRNSILSPLMTMISNNYYLTMT